jgi:hypothetical protein
MAPVSPQAVKIQPVSWDTATGQEMFALPGENVGFSPDGRYLLTQTADRMTHGYYLDANDLVALAQQRLFRWWAPDECQKYLHVEVCPTTQ